MLIIVHSSPYPGPKFVPKMLPKNSRRPLTLDHKIRLKKQRAKAFKSAGMNAEDTPSEYKRVHQQFKPRPEDKIMKKRRDEEYERNMIREVYH